MEGTDHTVAAWRKSTRSGGNGSNCVEVGAARAAVLVRDTKQARLGDERRTVLPFPASAWADFTATLKK